MFSLFAFKAQISQDLQQKASDFSKSKTSVSVMGCSSGFIPTSCPAYGKSQGPFPCPLFFVYFLMTESTVRGALSLTHS